MTERRSRTKRDDWATTPNARRKRPMITVTLAPEEIERLDALAHARGESRGAVLGALIRAAK